MVKRDQQEELNVQSADHDPSKAAACCSGLHSSDGEHIRVGELSSCLSFPGFIDEDLQSRDEDPNSPSSESDLQDHAGMPFDMPEFDTGEAEINDEANVSSSFYDCIDGDAALSQISQDDEIYFADNWDFEDNVNDDEEEISGESFEDDNDSDINSDPLFHGARISLPVSMLLIIIFAIGHA